MIFDKRSSYTFNQITEECTYLNNITKTRIFIVIFLVKEKFQEIREIDKFCLLLY